MPPVQQMRSRPSGSFLPRCRAGLRRSATKVTVLAGLLLAACSGSGGTGATGTSTTTKPQLDRVEFGRLADVYGLQVTGEGSLITLYRRDVLVGLDIRDERGSNDTFADSEILYDFIGADPDTLQPRLFIPRDINSQDFATAFAALDDQVRQISPMIFGQGGPGNPFGLIPRNAGIRLTFTASLGITDDFFVERDAQGQVTALRNTEAVQLLRIVGDPTQPNGFVPLPVRVTVQDNTLTLDPVMLGSEGLQYATTNNAAGMPASPDQLGANIRIAVALDGPLAIPGIRERENQALTGLNNSQRLSVVRDFRSGNPADTSADMARGFLRDPLPLRILGELVFYLERVDDINAFTQEITVYKNGIRHEIDRGDVMRIVADSSGVPLGTAEVVTDPEDDRGQPDVQHVRVRIRRIEGLEDVDPRNKPGYPESLPEREVWLTTNAPRSVCLTEYTAGDGVNGDDPRYFLSFTPAPLPNLDGTQPALNEFVAPTASAVVRFTKPVDISTVKWADTFFFAMRDLTSSASKAEFIANRPWRNADGTTGVGMEPATFNDAKYRRPYLITARVFDEDGSSTALRLQPTNGFYLDDTMRNAPAGADYRYFLHLIANSSEGGIRDLAGNAVDLQGSTAEADNSVVIPFTVDTRMNGNQPYFNDNLVVSIVNRFAWRDENEKPSYYMPDEVQGAGQAQKALSFPLEDLVGGFIYVDGRLEPRPTTRSRIAADNLNQGPVGLQGTPLAWCPIGIGSAAPLGEPQQSNNTATNLVGQGIQNPLNPYGARLQTVWREVDLSLSRTNPFDFNLDIEQMYWPPFLGTNLKFDELDRCSLWLGHSEKRPLPCVGQFSALPSLPNSGLSQTFSTNYVHNLKTPSGGSTIDSQPAPHPAYVDKAMTINPANVVYEPNNVLRYLPLPKFQKPYFVYRDETVVEQGCQSGYGNDRSPLGASYTPHLISPFNNGLGSRWRDTPNGVTFTDTFWNDLNNQSLTSGSDASTGGLVGNVALPLLADFWTYCDQPDLPAGNGYIAFGTNGWQTAVTVQSSPLPGFRAYSGGKPPITSPAQAPICIGPGNSQWVTAAGGYNSTGGLTGNAVDNTFYWIMMDVLKRQSVITSGFIDLNNPHRVPEGFLDPRLGPFYLVNGDSTRPENVVPTFAYEFDPPLDKQPGGTSIVPQFRGASIVDPTPWYWQFWFNVANDPRGLSPTSQWGPANSDQRLQVKPTAQNFPGDPFIAGDAHIRKYDTRIFQGSARNWWSYFYNRTVTTYVDNPNQLMSPAFTLQFKGPNESFTPRDIRYVNWRLVTSNNTEANPPVSPSIETFSLSYRFVRSQ
jgi:hypothetical protein